MYVGHLALCYSLIFVLVVMCRRVLKVSSNGSTLEGRHRLWGEFTASYFIHLTLIMLIRIQDSVAASWAGQLREFCPPPLPAWGVPGPDDKAPAVILSLPEENLWRDASISDIWPASAASVSAKESQSDSEPGLSRSSYSETKNDFHRLDVLMSNVDKKTKHSNFPCRHFISAIFTVFTRKSASSWYALFLDMKWPKSDDELVQTVCHPVIQSCEGRKKEEKWAVRSSLSSRGTGHDLFKRGEQCTLSVPEGIFSGAFSRTKWWKPLHEQNRERRGLESFLLSAHLVSLWLKWLWKSLDWNCRTQPKLIPTSVGGRCRAADSSVNFNPSDLDRPR